MRDTVNVIREGIPAVGLVHEPFETLARMQARQVGMAKAPLLFYARDLQDVETEAMLEKKAQDAATRAIDLLLTVGK